MQEMLVISALVGLATALGAGLVLLFGRPSKGMLALMLGFAAGVMLAIATLELLPEALEIGGTLKAIMGFLWGILLLYLVDLVLPHLHLNCANGDKQKARLLKVGYLIFIGIAVHNLAEGLAIGAGMVASPGLGVAIAIAIAVHNVPEGMATAVPLSMGGMPPLKLLVLVAAAGLTTVLGAWLGGVVFVANQALVGSALGLAAGAMFYIVGDELIPQAHCYDHYLANLGLVGGFVLGIFL